MAFQMRMNYGVLLVILCSWRQSCCSTNRGNIIFILADDLGWNDVGIHGMTQIPTPNIDSLAAHGVVLSSYYGAPMCTPSRAALMTGRYPSYLGLQHYVIPENGPWGLPIHVPTLADKLNGLGYVSRIVGKWHLGFYRSEHLPASRGFQSHFGFWTGAMDYFDHISYSSSKKEDYTGVPADCTNDTIVFAGHNLRDNMTERKDLSQQYLTDLLTERAVEIISTHDVTKPLFLLLAHHAPHRGNVFKPMRAPEKYTRDFAYIKDETRRNFAGAVKALDRSVGEVISALFSRGMLKDSTVIFSSDNGADCVGQVANGGSNWPLRGQKVTAWEGGVRVPAVVWSPRLKNPGRIWDGLMHVTDWLPTLYGFAGGDPGRISDLDGYNLWHSISENTSSPRNEVFLISDPIWKMSALRVGDFKLVNGSYPNEDFDGWYGARGREEVVHLLDHNEAPVSKLLGTYSGRTGCTAMTPTVSLKCGDKPKNDDQQCNAKEEICIFNIRDDPCEYRNLAKEDKQLLERLSARLREYEARNVQPLSTKRDYLANPVFYNGSWVPWRDVKYQEQ